MGQVETLPDDWFLVIQNVSYAPGQDDTNRCPLMKNGNEDLRTERGPHGTQRPALLLSNIGKTE